MKETAIEGIIYKLPNVLNDLQLKMYVHLINWKWKKGIKEPGKSRGNLYDAILPEIVINDYPIIYSPIKSYFLNHYEIFPFRIHDYFNHMASSQAANVNLFLPILTNSRVNEVMKLIKPDYKSLAKNTFLKNKLDDGYRIEFWDEPFSNLNDKNSTTGTDADIAIAYYNNENELCLWLVEHKLTEAEFTTCGGYKSKGRIDKSKHDCKQSFSAIIKNKSYCYYHDKCNYKYWDVTQKHSSFFMNHNTYAVCPFQSGMNQLWRNQLLGFSIEDDDRQPYEHVYFSVVRHPDNYHLENTIKSYKHLIGNNPKFSSFTSKDVIDKATSVNDPEINKWIEWYKDLYKIS